MFGNFFSIILMIFLQSLYISIQTRDGLRVAVVVPKLSHTTDTTIFLLTFYIIYRSFPDELLNTEGVRRMVVSQWLLLVWPGPEGVEALLQSPYSA